MPNSSLETALASLESRLAVLEKEVNEIDSNQKSIQETLHRIDKALEKLDMVLEGVIVREQRKQDLTNRIYMFGVGAIVAAVMTFVLRGGLVQ